MVANGVQDKAMYHRLTANGLGRVFYGYNLLRQVVGDPACPEQVRGRITEAAEALREYLAEQVPNGNGPGSHLLVDAEAPKGSING